MVASNCAKMANAYGGITYDVDENITNSLNKAFCMALLLVIVAAWMTQTSLFYPLAILLWPPLLPSLWFAWDWTSWHDRFSPYCPLHPNGSGCFTWFAQLLHDYFGFIDQYCKSDFHISTAAAKNDRVNFEASRVSFISPLRLAVPTCIVGWFGIEYCCDAPAVGRFTFEISNLLDALEFDKIILTTCHTYELNPWGLRKGKSYCIEVAWRWEKSRSKQSEC